MKLEKNKRNKKLDISIIAVGSLTLSFFFMMFDHYKTLSNHFYSLKNKKKLIFFNPALPIDQFYYYVFSLTITVYLSKRVVDFIKERFSSIRTQDSLEQMYFVRKRELPDNIQEKIEKLFHHEKKSQIRFRNKEDSSFYFSLLLNPNRLKNISFDEEKFQTLFHSYSEKVQEATQSFLSEYCFIQSAAFNHKKRQQLEDRNATNFVHGGGSKKIIRYLSGPLETIKTYVDQVGILLNLPVFSVKLSKLARDIDETHLDPSQLLIKKIIYGNYSIWVKRQQKKYGPFLKQFILSFEENENVLNDQSERMKNIYHFLLKILDPKVNALVSDYFGSSLDLSHSIIFFSGNNDLKNELKENISDLLLE